MLSSRQLLDYTALTSALQSRYGSQNELRSRIRKPGETLRELAAAIDRLTKKAYAHIPLRVQEELARDQFLKPGSCTLRTA